MNRAVWLVSAMALVLLAASCDDNEGPAPLPPNVRTWVSGVQVTAIGVGEEAIPLAEPVLAVFNPGSVPPESQGPPMLLGTTFPEVGTGTSHVYDIGTFARDHLAKFYVWVGEGSGFWEVTLPDPPGSTFYGVGMKVTITFAPNGPAGSFHLRLAGTDTLGKTGATSDQRNILFKTDSLQAPDVSAVLSWTGGSDLDLHVVDPFGHDLSTFNPTTPEGGVLEEDGSGGCVSDTTSHERALWPAGKAPLGEYRVFVVYYADCEEPATVPFAVMLKSKGSEDRELTGSFTGTAAGSAPDTVATFTIR